MTLPKFSGLEEYSLSIDPQFQSNTALYTIVSALSTAGKNVNAEVPDDFDGVVRPTLNLQTSYIFIWSIVVWFFLHLKNQYSTHSETYPASTYFLTDCQKSLNFFNIHSRQSTVCITQQGLKVH